LIAISEDAIDSGELVAADVVAVVGDRHFLEFQEGES
jgi:hypothetical protein